MKVIYEQFLDGVGSGVTQEVKASLCPLYKIRLS